MIIKPVVLSVAVAAAVAFATGCGSDESGSAAALGPLSTASLSKSQYIKKADAVCEKARGRMLEGVAAYEKQLGGAAEKTSEAEKIEATSQSVFLPAVGRQIEEIHKLGAPSGDSEQVEAILTAMQEAIDTSEGQAIASYGQLSREFRQPNDLAVKYGIASCALE